VSCNLPYEIVCIISTPSLTTQNLHFCTSSWANLFHYILQGLITNEMAGSEYHLDVGPILDGVNVSHLFAFDGGNKTLDYQLSSIRFLVSKVEQGTNPADTSLRPLIECALTHECFTNDTGFVGMSAGFVGCYMFDGIFSAPPCSEEFQAAAMTAKESSIAQCFSDYDVVNETQARALSMSSVHRKLFWFPGKNSSNPLPDESDEDRESVVLCLARAILPVDAVKKTTKIIRELLGIVSFAFAVVEGGIDIPGK
jgi:hypothetical protein